MSLVRIWTDVGGRKPVPLLAKIIDQDGRIFVIKYLSETSSGIWKYEEDTYEIDKDSIAENLHTDDENEVGFRAVEDGFLKVDFDESYIPEEEDEEDEEDEDEDEDEDDEEEDIEGYQENDDDKIEESDYESNVDED